MVVRETLGPQEVLIVGDEEKAAWTAMDLGVGSVATEASLPLSLAYLADTRQTVEALGNLDLDVVVEEDERWLLRLLAGSSSQGPGQALPLLLGKGSFP